MSESWGTDRGNSVTGPLQDKGPCSKASYLLGTVKEEIRTFISLTLNINCRMGHDAV
jgi:hypothetical protein